MAGLEQTIKEITNHTVLMVNEPMKNHTSFKIGGPADILVLPGCPEDIGSIFSLAKSERLPVILIGNGTNVLVSDKGIRGMVVKMSSFGKGVASIGEDCLEADAGASLTQLSLAAKDCSLTGLEFAYGIPGSVGGAVSMNAGAYGGEMKNVLKSSVYMDRQGNKTVLDNPGHEFGYRHSFFSDKEYIVVKSVFKLQKGDPGAIKAKMDEYTQARKDKQPLSYPSAGSVFKRPKGMFAGKLIEDCGLKGYRIGGAQVSQKHAGFIINCGDATAKDVRDLIRHIQQCVLNRFGVSLQCEIKFLGEE